MWTAAIDSVCEFAHTIRRDAGTLGCSSFARFDVWRPTRLAQGQMPPETQISGELIAPVGFGQHAVVVAQPDVQGQVLHPIAGVCPVHEPWTHTSLARQGWSHAPQWSGSVLTSTHENRGSPPRSHTDQPEPRARHALRP